ncbi:hypothetical protein HMPREF0322_03073 [Desulfitobacterium hafniense DP7]|uniref:Uncharacterized protein n=1 Tax=Desulfitobacterium hafniense DP7 TaxID=537010 RepID=G9XQ27_DESHA|nr:hypothetical protein HMPREF0322_03073 [Desulfitobacterium hafniense DP7]
MAPGFASGVNAQSKIMESLSGLFQNRVCAFCYKYGMMKI